MKSLRISAFVFTIIMIVLVPCTAFAARDDSASMLYQYTRIVTASLSISDAGQATCRGFVRASSPGSDISFTITLYRKSGTSWSKVTSWSNSDTSLILEIVKNRQVSAGTYKVKLTGSVTDSEGNTESIIASSSEVTYSN